MSVASLKFDQLKIEGVSTAGEETWFRVHPPGLAFDAGRGAPRLMGSSDVFLSHGHLDHSLGLPYLLSQRRLQKLGETRVYCPARLRKAVESLVHSAELLEDADYEWTLQGLEVGDRVQVGKDLVVEAFETDHVGPSLGYHLMRSRNKLLKRYRDLAPEKIVALKREGEVVEERREAPWLSYCGDTGVRVFDIEPRLFEVEVLLVECTFFEAQDRDRARRFMHMHIEDLAELAGRFRNSALILHHTSRRYSPRFLREEVDRALAGAQPEVHLLP